jgi:CheY-like chemotaxis protein
MHAGRIEGHSNGLGKGSTFTVRLPALKQQPEPTAPTRPETVHRAARRRVLVVDDLRDAADSLTALLRTLGHEVHVAYDGEAAIAAAESHRPDTVLLDLGMPKLNGYETCRLIRAQPWGKSICIVALTGWGQEADRQRTTQAGFNHHLVKPVDTADLMELLAPVTREIG